MATRASKQIPGINIRSPWSELIATGRKTVETRSYPLSKRYLGKPLAIIETHGKNSKTEPAHIIAIVTFRNCFLYKSKKEWQLDHKRHQVNADDPAYAFKAGVPKWGWEVESVIPLPIPQAAPKRRGIIYALSCTVRLPGF